MSSQASDPGVSTLPTVPAEATTRTMGLPQATSLADGGPYADDRAAFGNPVGLADDWPSASAASVAG